MVSEKDYLLQLSSRKGTPPRKSSTVKSIVVFISVGFILVIIAWTCFSFLQQPHPSYVTDLFAMPNMTSLSEFECSKDAADPRRTLTRIYDLPFATLSRQRVSKFEASDVTIVNGTVYAVCDSSWGISKFVRNAYPPSEDNKLIGPPLMIQNRLQHTHGDSGYEAIFEFGGVFYVVRESVNMHAIILELSLTNDSYEYIQECTCDFEFEDSNKGFEGAVGFPDSDGVLHILGLCEGNDCREKKMKSKVGGEGRVVIMKKSTNAVKGCHWETVRVVHIPKSAAFKDYSSIDITSSGIVAISSQESSSVWLSAVSGISNGVIDPSMFEFRDESSSVLRFPRNEHCHTVYCNIEGIHFISDDMLLAVSDRVKNAGRQDRICSEKDQSIHAFVIP